MAHRIIIAVCLATVLTLGGGVAKGDAGECAFDSSADEKEIIDTCTAVLSAASDAREKAELHLIRGGAYLALAGDDAESISSLRAFWLEVTADFGRDQSEIDKATDTYIPRAIADFDTAIEADPLLASAWFYRGYARTRSGDEDGGLTDFRRAAELDPETARNLLAVSILLARQGEFRASRNVVDEAIRIEPGNADHYAVRSLINMRLKDDQSTNDRNRALELDPENERIRRMFALVDALRQRARQQGLPPASKP